MQREWIQCCSCGAVTDLDETDCPVRCANNGKMEVIFLSPTELSDLVLQRKIWTKQPERLLRYCK